MKEWQTLQKSAYLSDFIELNKDLQRAVIRAIQELESDPTTPRGNTIKKLTGYENVYRYRLGDFRLIYAVESNARLIQLLAIGPRGSVYKRFNYQGWDAPNAAVTFGPELAATPEWMNRPEWFAPDEPKKQPLPRKITPELLSKWRIPAEYHQAFLRCRYDDDLLNLTEEEVPGEIVSQVLDALYPATVERIAAQPDQVLLDPEDLARYAEGTLTSFLLHLDEQQRPLTNWALSGPTLVKGGPGSGKSTVALYRIRANIEHALATNGKVPSILFTTYTNALINSSRSLLQQLLRDILGLKSEQKLPKEVRVTTFHRTAQWIAKRSGQLFNMAQEGDREEALRAARAMLQPRGLGDAAKLAIADTLAPLRDEYLLDEFDWIIEGQNCQTEADYLAAERTGRGQRFNRQTRQAVWALYEAYKAYLLGQNKYTWGHLTQIALEEVRSGRFDRRWDYVIVDEAQDLPPVALSLCVELCQSPAGVFLTADANQSLYNRGFRWQHVHKDLQVKGRGRILRRNYRSTQQIAAAASQILRPTPDFDEEAIAQEYVHVGPQPVLYAAAGSEDQAQWIARQVYQAARQLRLPVNAAVVLVASSSVGEPLAEAISKQGLPAQFMKSNEFDLRRPCIKVTTLHAAKGLEFPIVVIAHVEAGRLPRETAATDPEEISSFECAQRRLFYVGCTRAMRYLFVTYDRQLPSPFLANLTEPHWQRA